MLLNLFNKYIVADEFMEAAYEGVSLEIKGWIKKNLALCRNYYRPDMPAEFSSTTARIENTLITAAKRVCDSVLILYPASYSACGRAVAASAPAFFAGVETVIAVAVHDPEVPCFQVEGRDWFENDARPIYRDFPLDFNLLASWEVCGVEEIALLPLNMLDQILGKVGNIAKNEAVRVMVLGSPAWEKKIFGLKKTQNLQIWNETVPEKIQVQSGLREELRLLKTLHPDSKIVSASSPTPSAKYLVGDDGFRLKAEQPVLALSPEYAGCWVWPDLPLDFFRLQSVDVGQ